MSCWEKLGIAPTSDPRVIKHAYARLLKTTRPDDDPVAFNALRMAYEQALRSRSWIQEAVDDADRDASASTEYFEDDTAPFAAQRHEPLTETPPPIPHENTFPDQDIALARLFGQWLLHPQDDALAQELLRQQAVIRELTLDQQMHYQDELIDWFAFHEQDFPHSMNVAATLFDWPRYPHHDHPHWFTLSQRYQFLFDLEKGANTPLAEWLADRKRHSGWRQKLYALLPHALVLHARAWQDLQTRSDAALALAKISELQALPAMMGWRGQVNTLLNALRLGLVLFFLACGWQWLAHYLREHPLAWLGLTGPIQGFLILVLVWSEKRKWREWQGKKDRSRRMAKSLFFIFYTSAVTVLLFAGLRFLLARWWQSLIPAEAFSISWGRGVIVMALFLLAGLWSLILRNQWRKPVHLPSHTSFVLWLIFAVLQSAVWFMPKGELLTSFLIILPCATLLWAAGQMRRDAGYVPEQQVMTLNAIAPISVLLSLAACLALFTGAHAVSDPFWLQVGNTTIFVLISLFLNHLPQALQPIEVFCQWTALLAYLLLWLSAPVAFLILGIALFTRGEWMMFVAMILIGGYFLRVNRACNRYWQAENPV